MLISTGKKIEVIEKSQIYAALKRETFQYEICKDRQLKGGTNMWQRNAN